jgi:4-amino-4-deoxy-L-arabinose transferase-like glycosyltransferase
MWSDSKLWAALTALALATGAALLVAPWAGHIDDPDTQLYQVVARHFAQDRTWLDARYLPAVYPHFREHLPFGLWPFVVAIRLFGEGALAPLAALMSLGTLGLVAWIGWRWLGPPCAFVATLVLATTESFFFYGGRLRLDVPLVLLATSASVPFLLGASGLFACSLAAGLAALAVLVKGPFGLIPLVAVILARAWVDRSKRMLWLGAITVVVAVLPAAVFLLVDRYLGTATWWDGYLNKQVMASALGGREDGHFNWWFPLASIAGRFWPGLPFVALGAAYAAGIRLPSWLTPGGPGLHAHANTAAKVLTIEVVLALGALCVPYRKVWNHALVVYPPLALLAGLGGAGIALRFASNPTGRRALQTGASIVATAAWAFALFGAGRLLLRSPCVASAEFAGELGTLPVGEPVLLVSAVPDWRLIANLAAERAVNPVPMTAFPSEADDSIRVAIVSEELRPASSLTWSPVAQARGWVLMRRRQPTLPPAGSGSPGG